MADFDYKKFITEAKLNIKVPVKEMARIAKEKYKLNEEEVEYFIFHDKLINNAYNKKKEKINILMKNGSLLDISKASDNLNISALAHPVEKYFLCYPN